MTMISYKNKKKLKILKAAKNAVNYVLYFFSRSNYFEYLFTNPSLLIQNY